MRFLDLFPSVGALRLGLQAQGHRCVAAVEPARDASAVYEHVHSARAYPDLQAALASSTSFDCVLAKITPVSREYPARATYDETIQALLRVAESCKPHVILMEGARWCLNARFGYHTASMLTSLARSGYATLWMRQNHRELGVPHDRDHVLYIAHRTDARLHARSQASERAVLFAMSELGGSTRHVMRGRLADLVESRRPLVGAPAPLHPSPFGGVGFVAGDTYWTVTRPRCGIELNATDLARVVAPSLRDVELLSAVRFTSRYGTRQLLHKTIPASFAMGPGYSANPLFAIPTRHQDVDREASEFANWYTRAGNSLVFRLTPERSVLLNGTQTAAIGIAMSSLHAPLQRKYELAASVVPTSIADTLLRMAEVLRRSIITLWE